MSCVAVRRVLSPAMRRLPLLLAVVVLVAAVVVQAFNPYGEARRTREPHLAAAIPLEVAGGWRGEDTPLGATEFQQGQVAKVLRYDDVLNRTYRRGRDTFSVYIAYWGAGRMPQRLVASHTPDRCWTETGWECTAMRFDERLVVDGRPLQAADWRIFRDRNGDAVEVVFWHLVDGRAYDYGERFNKIPHPLEWWRDAARQAVSGSREQYFVRLSSSLPFEEALRDPAIRELVRGVAALGVAEES